MMTDIDWQDKYLAGEMPLYDAMLCYMGEGRQIPPLIYQAFNDAILNYQYGLTDSLDIGLDAHFEKSVAKRFKESNSYSYTQALIREVEAFNKIGLSKVKASNARVVVEPKIRKEALEYIKNHPYMKNKLEPQIRKIIQDSPIDITAYQATSILFNTSEATVRRKASTVKVIKNPQI